MVGTVTWVLTHATRGETIADGRHETFTSYAATGSTTATQAAETDATARLSVALADMIGLDTMLAVMQVFYEGFDDPKYRPAQRLKEMVAAGRLGRKTGQGFYRYDCGPEKALKAWQKRSKFLRSWPQRGLRINSQRLIA